MIEEKIKDELLKLVNDPVRTGSPISPPNLEKTKRRLTDSFDSEPDTCGMANNTCLKRDLVMMLDSSNECEGTAGNSSLDALL